MPERIRLRRAAGWRKPPGAVVVARPSRWGNPFPLEEVRAEHPDLPDHELRGIAVGRFRAMVEGDADGRGGYPALADIRAELAGRDLACWCPLDGPCHADVLLALANA